jgi:riboflavin transporter FmnP
MTFIMTVLNVLFVLPFWKKIIMILLDNENDKDKVRDNLFSAGFRYWVKINKISCIATCLVNRALHDSCHSGVVIKIYSFALRVFCLKLCKLYKQKL